MIYIFCYKRGREKETDEQLKSVLIPNKYTHESPIKCGVLAYGSSKQTKKRIRCFFNRCSIASNRIEMVQGWMMI